MDVSLALGDKIEHKIKQARHALIKIKHVK